MTNLLVFAIEITYSWDDSYDNNLLSVHYSQALG